MSTSVAPELQQKIHQYRKLLSGDPRSKAFVPLAEIYRKQSLLDDALEIAEAGVQALPSYALGYVVLARIQAQRGLLDESIATFERALVLDGDNVDALKGLAKILIAKDNNRRARVLLDRVLAIQPGDRTTRQMLELLGPPPETPVSEAPAPPSSEDIDAITTATIAEIYIKQGYPRRALQVFRGLLAAHPDSARYHRRVEELEALLEEGVDAPAPEQQAAAAVQSEAQIRQSAPPVASPPDQSGPSPEPAPEAAPEPQIEPRSASWFSSEPDSEEVPSVEQTHQAATAELTKWLDAIIVFRQMRRQGA